jgi:hypothetical protein
VQKTFFTLVFSAFNFCINIPIPFLLEVRASHKDQGRYAAISVSPPVFYSALDILTVLSVHGPKSYFLAI